MHPTPSPVDLRDAAEAACRAGVRAGFSDVDARDLAQEALLRALGPAPPPPDVSLTAWVYGIARNLSRDHAKSAQRREVLVDEVPATPAERGDLVDVLTVQRALAELPAPLRDVMVLHELEGHTLREAAIALRIPFDTAKDRLRRARLNLAASLGAVDAACERERAHTRRRAAASGAAIVAAVLAGGVDVAHAAAGASSGGAVSAPSLAVGTGSVRAAARSSWTPAVVGAALLSIGFVAGRVTAPRRAAAPPQVISAPSAEPRPIVDADAPAVAPLAARVPVAPPTAAGDPDATPAPSRARPTRPVVVASSAPAAAIAPSAASSPDPAPPPSAIEAERLQLDRARAALRRGTADEAIVTLMGHARTSPDGVLRKEREALLVEAYLAAGDPVRARAVAERYRRAYPRGVLRRRVDALVPPVVPPAP